MPADKIKFTKEKETMLMTLFPRAMQSKWKGPILRDPWAEDAIQHIDYDAGKMFKGVFGKMVARFPAWADYIRCVGPLDCEAHWFQCRRYRGIVQIGHRQSPGFKEA